MTDASTLQILILSDVHYAGAEERTRVGYDLKAIESVPLRWLVKLYRRYIWLRDPLGQNHLLQRIMDAAPDPDLVVANGDYTCDTRFIGVTDPAAQASAAECLTILRTRYAGHSKKTSRIPRFHAVIGDHELGKKGLGSTQGGLRWSSFKTAVNELGLSPFWKLEVGCYVLMGVTSSVLAFPVLEPEALPEERADWNQFRGEHFDEIRSAFAELKPNQRVILFCHDPTALPFLHDDPVIRDRLHHVERTIIGHLHTPLIHWQSRMLAGMPVIHCLGTTARRMTSALNRAKHWRPFHVLCCPSPSGVQLLKDGGFYLATIDPQGNRPAVFERQHLAW